WAVAVARVGEPDGIQARAIGHLQIDERAARLHVLGRGGRWGSGHVGDAARDLLGGRAADRRLPGGSARRLLGGGRGAAASGRRRRAAGDGGRGGRRLLRRSRRRLRGVVGVGGRRLLRTGTATAGGGHQSQRQS